MKRGDTVILCDWVDIARLRMCKVSIAEAEALRGHTGTFAVLTVDDSNCGYFDGPWIRVRVPASPMTVYLKRCYFELVSEGRLP